MKDELRATATHYPEIDHTPIYAPLDKDYLAELDADDKSLESQIKLLGLPEDGDTQWGDVYEARRKGLSDGLGLPVDTGWDDLEKYAIVLEAYGGEMGPEIYEGTFKDKSAYGTKLTILSALAEDGGNGIPSEELREQVESLQNRNLATFLGLSEEDSTDRIRRHLKDAKNSEFVFQRAKERDNDLPENFRLIDITH